MTVALEEFTKWRDSVEARLGKLETVSDRHAEAIDRQGVHLVSMDEDFSQMQVEFRAQRRMLQALHDTQNDHTARLTRVEVGIQDLNGRVGDLNGRVRDLNGRVRDLNGRVQELEVGMHEVRVGVQTIIGLLDRNIERNGE